MLFGNEVKRKQLLQRFERCARRSRPVIHARGARAHQARRDGRPGARTREICKVDDRLGDFQRCVHSPLRVPNANGLRTTENVAATAAEVVARGEIDVVLLERMCAPYNVPVAAAALQFPLRHAAVESVVVGARSAAEIEEDVRLHDVPVPDALWSEIDAAYGTWSP